VIVTPGKTLAMKGLVYGFTEGIRAAFGVCSKKWWRKMS